METIKDNLKSAISALYSKKFFQNYDNLDLTGVDQDFLDQILKIFLNEMKNCSVSETGTKKLAKILNSSFAQISEPIVGCDFEKFSEVERLSKKCTKLFHLKKSFIKKVKQDLDIELKKLSKVETGLNNEEIVGAFSYLAENIVFQKKTRIEKTTFEFSDPYLEEQIVEYWNEYYGSRYEEVSKIDFDFDVINENIANAIGANYRHLLDSNNYFIEYHFEPKTITIKSINGVSLFEPLKVVNYNPRKNQRNEKGFGNLG